MPSKRKWEILRDLDSFTTQYLETALWSSTDDSTESGGYPLDDNYGIHDIEIRSLRDAVKVCAEFQKDNADDLAGIEPSQAGHDFWLTRNGHGAGFWDRGLGDIGERLTKASKVYGGIDPYVHRGKVYIRE